MLTIDYVATSSHSRFMLAVGIKQLKDKLSEYLRLVSGGETVLVTDHNRVVAEIRAPSSDRLTASNAQLADLIKSGLVRPPLAAPGTTAQRLAGLRPVEQILRDLGSDRGDR